MGYYPSDMMSDYLAEHIFYYDYEEHKWSWEEEDDERESLGYLQENGELKYDPAEKAAEIEAAEPDDPYILVFHTGEWFETAEEAYLFMEEKRTLVKMLKSAFECGYEERSLRTKEDGFGRFFAAYTHGGKVND